MELVLGILIGAAVMWVRAKLRRKAGIERAKEWDVSNPENQLRFLEQASLYTSNPINKEAFKTVFTVVERTLKEMQPRYRLLAEVSMGSFLGTSKHGATQNAQNRAFSSFNSKRVDFLIIDGFGKPKLVIEYHGSGHFQGNAEERDAVKQLALEKAGVPLLVIYEGADKREVGNKVRWWLKNKG